MLVSKDIMEFVRESNRIEGIRRDPFEHEVEATADFIYQGTVAVPDLVRLVGVLEPGAKLRESSGLNVRVGNHFPPAGGPHIVTELCDILVRASENVRGSYRVHHDYETLHPFTDGNGRSGRALWARMQLQGWGDAGLSLGFLHRWYYQSLAAGH